MAPKTPSAQPKRDEPKGPRASASSAVKAGPPLAGEQLLRQAVALWLDWNEAYEQATERAFQSGHDQRKLEAIMDQMDAVRRQAILVSRKALS